MIWILILGILFTLYGSAFFVPSFDSFIKKHDYSPMYYVIIRPALGEKRADKIRRWEERLALLIGLLLLTFWFYRYLS